MKLVNKNLELKQPGTVKLTPEEPDDLWLVYNLIAPGDVIATHTTRKVHLHSTKNNASRVKLTLHIKVTRRDFHKDSSTVRVQGNNIDHSNPYVAAGSFHTLTLERNKAFELQKKIWDSVSVDTLSESSEKSAGADLALVLMQEDQAQIYLLGRRVTTLCSKIQASSPAARKRASSINVFFQDVFNAFVKYVDFDTVKSVVIASPTWTKDEFRSFLLSEAKRLKMKSIEDNKSRIVVVGTSPGSNLKEILNDSTVMNIITDSEAALEIRGFKEFEDLLSSNSERACYGPKNVETAQEMMAIETLLITDDLYRSSEIGTRQKYVGLVKSVKEGGGKALVYSSMHVSAEQLTQLTGIAAILRFPLPHLQEMDV